jgi:hypothetical protein
MYRAAEPATCQGREGGREGDKGKQEKGRKGEREIEISLKWVRALPML